MLQARLTPREQLVIRMRFDLDEASGQKQTSAAIGQQLGPDDSTVYEIAQRALRKMCTDEHVQGAPHRTRTSQRHQHYDRFVATCSQLEAQGCAITAPRLCALAKVSFRVAAAFPRAQPPAPKPRLRLASSRPTRPSQQERLLAAWALLEAQGKLITRATVRKLTGVSTDAARAFLQPNGAVIDRAHL